MNRLRERRLSRTLEELFGDFGTGAAPSVGAKYTDKDTVIRVQKALYVDPDGIIGPKTRAAVKAFNEKRGAPQDGENITDGLLAALAARDAEAASWPVFGPSMPEVPAASTPSSPSYVSTVTAAPRVVAKPPVATAGFSSMPWWQVALAVLGVGAIGAGTYMLVRKK